jgi:acylphosphatase
MRRLTATVVGVVQGVGFRAFVIRHAQRLGLVGRVSNASDETVRVIAEGDEDRLDDLLDLLRQGPRASRVDRVDFQYGPASGEFGGFDLGWGRSGF